MNDFSVYQEKHFNIPAPLPSMVSFTHLQTVFTLALFLDLELFRLWPCFRVTLLRPRTLPLPFTFFRSFISFYFPLTHSPLGIAAHVMENIATPSLLLTASSSRVTATLVMLMNVSRYSRHTVSKANIQ